MHSRAQACVHTCSHALRSRRTLSAHDRPAHTRPQSARMLAQLSACRRSPSARSQCSQRLQRSQCSRLARAPRSSNGRRRGRGWTLTALTADNQKALTEPWAAEAEMKMLSHKKMVSHYHRHLLVYIGCIGWQAISYDTESLCDWMQCMLPVRAHWSFCVSYIQTGSNHCIQDRCYCAWSQKSM